MVGVGENDEERAKDDEQEVKADEERVKADVEFESFSIHLAMNTPRVVEDLHSLWYCSVDDFRKKLSTREITVHDVDEDGWPIIYVCCFSMYALTALMHYHNCSTCLTI